MHGAPAALLSECFRQLQVCPRKCALPSQNAVSECKYFSIFAHMLKLTISPQAKRAETNPRHGTPTMSHFQPPQCCPLLRGGRVLLTEILLPRIARQGAVCLISTRG